MATISVTNINDGDAVTAASINNQVNTIVNDYNGNITDANVSASAAIGAQKIAGGVSGMFGAWNSWSPTYTNITVGNGTVVSKYIQIGKTVHFRFSFVLGSTSAVGGVPIISLPVTSVSYSGTALNQIFGNVRVLDSSAGTVLNGVIGWLSTTTIRPQIMTATGGAGTGIGQVDITATVPWTWATSDEIVFQGTYEAA